MAEKTFRSPGVFQQEVDLTQRVQAPLGTPAGIIGTSQRGPAFVPVTVGGMADFNTKFGSLDSKMFGPYAVNEFLRNKIKNIMTEKMNKTVGWFASFM